MGCVSSVPKSPAFFSSFSLPAILSCEPHSQAGWVVWAKLCMMVGCLSEKEIQRKMSPSLLKFVKYFLIMIREYVYTCTYTWPCQMVVKRSTSDFHHQSARKFSLYSVYCTHVVMHVARNLHLYSVY